MFSFQIIVSKSLSRCIFANFSNVLSEDYFTKHPQSLSMKLKIVVFQIQVGMLPTCE